MWLWQMKSLPQNTLIIPILIELLAQKMLNLRTFTTRTSGRDMQLSKAVFPSNTRSGEASGGLSWNIDSNMVPTHS